MKECLAESEFERCTTLVSCNTCQRVASSEIKVFRLLFLYHQAPFVHLYLYLVDSTICFPNTYPLGSDLSDG